MPRRALLALLAATGAACGTPSAPAVREDLAAASGVTDLATASASDLAAAPDLFAMLDMAAPPVDLANAPYPAGPYGAKVGDTFPKLAWIGYADEAGDAIATMKPYGAYSADTLFRSGRPYGLVHIAEVY
jgi:hypothetical protein